MSDLALLSITELAALIGGGEVPPVEVMEATLARIERLNPKLNAFISVYPEQALEAARAAEARIQAGGYLGPLDGVPIGIKDLFEVSGMVRTCGSKILDEGVAEHDAVSVARLKAAGAIIVGLLNLNEFAYGATGINIHVGSARNPWKLDTSCGGSSAGAGCAVAASLVPGAMGTDTGGSVRLPASLCGVVGLKQTYGLASRTGIYPLCGSFDHGGPLTRSVADNAIMLQAIAGEDPLDETTRGAVVGDFSADLGRDLRGARFGVPKQVFFDDLHPGTEAAVRAAIDALADLGAEIAEADLPFVDAAIDSWNTMALAEAYAVHDQHLKDHPGQMAPEVEVRLLRGRDISARDYLAARDHQSRVKQEMAAVMSDFDALVMPTAPVPAVSIDTGLIEVNGNTVDGAQILGRLTRLANFTGQSSISVPCGFTDEGLPVGLQLIGHSFGDAALLGLAAGFERATPWHERRPDGLD